MALDLIVSGDGWLRLGALRYRCALGRGGLAADKREGDGATPLGRFPLRRVLYRPDRLPPPETVLPVAGSGRQDGWCDDPADPENYNRQVLLPHPYRAERLWRDDAIYDLLAVIGHNDDPVVPGAGSAIFLHLARPGWEATEGCVALAPEAMGDVLRRIGRNSHIDIRGQPG